MITMNCRHCGKPFAFSLSGTRNAVVRQFADSAPEKRDYFPSCTHCGKPNTFTVEKRK